MPKDNESASEQESLSGEALQKYVQENVSEAFKSHMKSFNDMASKFEQKMNEAMAKFGAASETNKKTESKTDNDETSKKLTQLQQMLEEQTNKAQKAEEAQKLERLLNIAREKLGSNGIPGDRIPIAMAYLHDQNKLFTYDDNGTPGFKGRDKWGAEAVLPIEEGIKSWLSSTEGKFFLPPVDKQGAGHAKSSTSFNGKTGGKVDWDNPVIVNPFSIM